MSCGAACLERNYHLSPPGLRRIIRLPAFQVIVFYAGNHVLSHGVIAGQAEALKAFPQSTSVVLYTDSQYLKKGFTDGWVKKWKLNGWMTSTKEPVKNQDFWIQLDQLTSFHKVTWKWVKGHNGNPLNERCDELAVGAATAKAREIGWSKKR